MLKNGLTKDKLQKDAFKINLDDQMVTRKKCRADRIKLYDGRLQTFIDYLAIGNYSIDEITSHHPILICDYLKRQSIKSTSEDGIVYISLPHWENSWSALANYYSNSLTSGWPRSMEPFDDNSISDIFGETPSFFFNYKEFLLKGDQNVKNILI